MEEVPNSPPPAPHRHPMDMPDAAALFPMYSRRLNSAFRNKERVNALRTSAPLYSAESKAAMHSTEALLEHVRRVRDSDTTGKAELSERDKEWAATEASDWRRRAAATLEPNTQSSDIASDSEYIIETDDKVLRRRKIGKQVNAKLLEDKERAWGHMRHPLQISAEHDIREKTYKFTYSELTDCHWSALDMDMLRKRCCHVENTPLSTPIRQQSLHLPSTLGLHGAVIFAEHGDDI